MLYLQKSRGILRVLLSITLAFAFLTGGVRGAEYVAVVSLKPSDQLFQDLDYLLKATGTQAFGQMFLPPVKAYFEGINGKQPIGMVLSMDDSQVEPLVFVPVTNLQKVLQQFREQVGEPIDAGNGVLELQGPQPMFIKEQNGWAFIGQTAQSLATLPPQPAQLLDGLYQRYDLAIRANVKNIPPSYREMVATQLGELMAQGVADSDDPNARVAVEAQLERFRTMMDELDSFTLGWQINAADRSTSFDVAVKALPQSKAAKQLTASADATTQFGGFLVDGAAVKANLASKVLPEQIEDGLMSLDRLQMQAQAEIDKDDLQDAAARDAAKQLVRTLIDVAKNTIKSGQMDGCMSVILRPNAMTVVAASHVANGADVEKAMSQLIEVSRSSEEITFRNVQLNAQTHNGVRLHTMEVPIPPDEYIGKVLGDTLKIVVGTSGDSAYVALGTDALATLKGRIDASSSADKQTVHPFELDLALPPILEFAKSIEPNPLVEALAQMVASKKGKDHLRVRFDVQGETATYRLTLEEGVLSLLGQGAMIGVQSQSGF